MFMNSYEDDGSVSDSSILLLRRWGTKERSAHDSAAMAIAEEADMRLEETGTVSNSRDLPCTCRCCVLNPLFVCKLSH